METLLRDIVRIVTASYPLAAALTWFVAVVLLVSGTDDLLMDLAYWYQRIFRNRRFTQHGRIPLEDLHGSPEKLIAMFVPTWREENVLEQMLTRACESIDYGRYDIFVGVYPNDPRTLEKARRAADRFPRIHVVIGGHAGPSSKAENLNEIFEGMIRYENRTGVRYELIVLHDAEDVIHPQSLRAFNVFIPRYDMVQLPVFPLPVPARKCVHWVYADEFAENHTKELLARQAVSGFVPSAGVGTAFNRWILEFAGTSFARNLFSRRSLTEDYDMALRLALAGAKLAFLYRPFGQQIATWAYFPQTFQAAVRQRTRWLIGICLQTWRSYGWRGGLRLRAILVRDRKAILVNIVSGLSYAVLLYVAGLESVSRGLGGTEQIQPVVEKGSALWYIVFADTLLMLWRILQRYASVRRVYGHAAALLSIPRLAVGNVINFAAAVRAIGQALSYGLRGRRIPWEKTVHVYPAVHDPAPG
jgi:bacteriophage N4 adsorption protein B